MLRQCGCKGSAGHSHMGSTGQSHTVLCKKMPLSYLCFGTHCCLYPLAVLVLIHTPPSHQCMCLISPSQIAF